MRKYSNPSSRKYQLFSLNHSKQKRKPQQRPCLFCKPCETSNNHSRNVDWPMLALQHQLVSAKYCASQNYFYSKDINDLLENTKTKYTLLVKDLLVLDDSSQEILDSYIRRRESERKIGELGEYYKYYKDLPRMHIRDVEDVYRRFHELKRVIEYNRLKAILSLPKSQTNCDKQDRQTTINKDNNNNLSHSSHQEKILAQISGLTNFHAEESRAPYPSTTTLANKIGRRKMPSKGPRQLAATSRHDDGVNQSESLIVLKEKLSDLISKHNSFAKTQPLTLIDDGYSFSNVLEDFDGQGFQHNVKSTSPTKGVKNPKDIYFSRWGEQGFLSQVSEICKQNGSNHKTTASQPNFKTQKPGFSLVPTTNSTVQGTTLFSTQSNLCMKKKLSIKQHKIFDASPVPLANSSSSPTALLKKTPTPTASELVEINLAKNSSGAYQKGLTKKRLSMENIRSSYLKSERSVDYEVHKMKRRSQENYREQQLQTSGQARTHKKGVMVTSPSHQLIETKAEQFKTSKNDIKKATQLNIQKQLRQFLASTDISYQKHNPVHRSTNKKKNNLDNGSSPNYNMLSPNRLDRQVSTDKNHHFRKHNRVASEQIQQPKFCELGNAGGRPGLGHSRKQSTSKVKITINQNNVFNITIDPKPKQQQHQVGSLKNSIRKPVTKKC